MNYPMIIDLTAMLGQPQVEKMGQEFLWNCPFCLSVLLSPDLSRNLAVNPVRRKFRCWRCETQGSFRYLSKLLKIDDPEEGGLFVPGTGHDWDEAIDRFMNPSDPADGDLPFALPEGFSPLDTFGWTLSSKYALGRGLTPDDIKFYKLHYGVGRYRHRVVFPCYMNGKLVFWNARLATDDSTVADSLGLGKAPKYINPPAISRDRILYNFDGACQYDHVILTEGVLSCIAAGRSAVATYGKHVSDGQLSLLAGQSFKEYYVCMDGDAWSTGLEVAQRLAQLGASRVKFVRLPYKEDPASIGRQATYDLISKTEYYEFANHEYYLLQLAGSPRRRPCEFQGYV